MAQMQCVKTGCHLYSSEYGMYFRGDLYYKGDPLKAFLLEEHEVETHIMGVWVLKFNHESWEPIVARLHCRVNSIDLVLGMHQVGKGVNFGTIIFTRCAFFDYEGRPLIGVFNND